MHDGSDVAPLVLKLEPEVLELKIWYILLGRFPVVKCLSCTYRCSYSDFEKSFPIIIFLTPNLERIEWGVEYVNHKFICKSHLGAKIWF